MTMVAANTNLGEIDLADADLYVPVDGGLPTFDLLRRERPVYWNRSSRVPDFWALTRHRDALSVYQDPESFTSELGMHVAQHETATRAASGKMLIVTDEPRHRALRHTMTALLQPSSLAKREPAMRRLLTRCLDGVGERPFDFVQSVAAQLPLTVICQMLGVPEGDWDLMGQLTRTAFGSVSTDAVLTEAQKAEANANIFAYYGDLIPWRRKSPGDDLLSALTTARVDGRPLTDEEIVLNVSGLITGGNETTRHASAGALLALMEWPAEWDRLKREDGILRTAVEEVLRWTSPSLNVMRTARNDVVVGGQLIRAGERVSIWHPAVNRDEETFPHANRFDIARKPNRHLTFGLGHHYCIGAALARLELRVLLDVLRTEVRWMSLMEPVKRLRSNLMWGYDRVVVSFVRTVWP